jgi:hypothetical protein
MRRRPICRNVKCSEPTCHDYAHYEYSSRREYNEAVQRNAKYTCCLHDNPGRVLSTERLRVEWVSEPVMPSATYPNIPRTTLFFGHCGVLIHQAFYARAEDFPLGTRIRITAEVLLPEATQ